MVLDDLVKKATKKTRDNSILSQGFGMFERKVERAKKIVRKKAINENLYAIEVVIRLLNMYKKPHSFFDKNRINSYRKLKKKGVETSHIKKATANGITRIYLREKGVLSMLKYYYDRNNIIDYKKKNVPEDLKKAAYQA